MGYRKRKRASELEGEELLNFILTDSSSKLGSVDINNVINEDTWYRLSSEARLSLCKLLPRSFFDSYTEELDWSHPAQPVSKIPEGFGSIRDIPEERFPVAYTEQNQNGAASSSSTSQPRQEDRMDVSDEWQLTEEEISAGPMPTFMSDAHFRSACLAFQDHLSAGNMESKQLPNLTKFRQSITLGSRHIPWKDEVWAEGRRPSKSSKQSKPLPTSPAHAFHPLISNNLLSEGDIISFSASLSPQSSSPPSPTKPTSSPSTSSRQSDVPKSSINANQVIVDVLLTDMTPSKSFSTLTFVLPPIPDLSLPEYSSNEPIHITLPPRLAVPQLPPGISARDASNTILFNSSLFPPFDYHGTLHEADVRSIEELLGVIISRLPTSLREMISWKDREVPPEPDTVPSGPMFRFVGGPSTSAEGAVTSSTSSNGPPPPDMSHFRLKSLRVYRWNSIFREEMLPLWLEAVNDVGVNHSTDTLGPRGGRTGLGSLFHMWCVAGS